METFTGGSYNRYLEHRRSRVFDQPALDGHSAVLNFINTGRNPKGRDCLQGYDAFLYWCHKAAIIDVQTYEDLNLEAYCYFTEADTLFRDILEARETLAELFDAIQSGKEAPMHVAPRFNRLVATVRQHISYGYANGSLYEAWVNTDQELAAPLWSIIADAMRLLQSHQLARLKKCPGCGSLYIDNTRNNIRSWCNPMACGKRIRNRKYYKGKVLGEKG